MVILAIWRFLCTFGPYIAAGLLAMIVYFAGCYQVLRQWDAREAQLKAESNQLLLSAYDKNARLQQSLEQSAAIIGETYDAHQKNISDLADHNQRLLDQRMRQSVARRDRCAVPSAAGGAGASDDSAAGTDAFLASAGASLVDEAARADAVSGWLRACQAWIASVQQSFGDKSEFANPD